MKTKEILENLLRNIHDKKVISDNSAYMAAYNSGILAAELSVRRAILVLDLDNTAIQPKSVEEIKRTLHTL